MEMTAEMARGIAHVYAGLVKSDGVLTDDEQNERTLTKILRFKSKNIYYLDGHEYEQIHESLVAILDDSSYKQWDAYQHLEKGAALIAENARQLDDIEPISQTMLQLAKIDSLTIPESRFIRETTHRLNSFR